MRSIYSQVSARPSQILAERATGSCQVHEGTMRQASRRKLLFLLLIALVALIGGLLHQQVRALQLASHDHISLRQHSALYWLSKYIKFDELEI